MNKTPADKNVIKVKVVKDLDISTYTTTEKTTKTYGSTVLCDSTSYANVIVHDQDTFKNFKANNNLLLQNYTVEENEDAKNIVITKKTKVYLAAPVEVPDNILTSAKEEATKHLKIVSIHEAGKSPKKRRLSIEGKVTKVSPTKKVRNDTLPLRNITVKDTTGSINVALWRDKASIEISKGQVVKISDVKPSTYMKEVVLSSSDSSEIQVLPDSELSALSSESDDDSGSHSHSSANPKAQIVGLNDIKQYQACNNPGCFKKKLYNNRCPTCNTDYTTTSKAIGMLSNMIILTDDGEYKNVTIFNDNLKSLLHSQDDIIDADTATSLLLQQLPLSIQYKLTGSVITSVKIIPSC